MIVDGQHRVAALDRLMERDPDQWEDDFGIPFVCLLGADEREEMEQFDVVQLDGQLPSALTWRLTS